MTWSNKNFFEGLGGEKGTFGILLATSMRELTNAPNKLSARRFDSCESPPPLLLAISSSGPNFSFRYVSNLQYNEQVR